MVDSIQGFSSFCGVKIRVLPDFLMDHTLLQQDLADRLPEHCSRWIQFVERLAVWRGKATFCLRFDGRPSEGAVGIYFLGRSHDPANRERLKNDIEFALTAYGILNDVNDPKCCLPLLTREEIARYVPNVEEREEVEAEILSEFGKVLASELTEKSAHVAVSQDVTSELVLNPNFVAQVADSSDHDEAEGSEAKGWVPLLWEGPTGSFLLPFKALMASQTSLQLSVYLEPCALEDEERNWLFKLGMYAGQEVIRGSSLKDSSAQIAAEHCAAAYRRLFNDAFLVSVVVVAPDGNRDAATNVANTIQALCVPHLEKDFDNKQNSYFASRIAEPSAEHLNEAKECHLNLRFPSWSVQPNMPKSLRRLTHLTDTRGAATVFRLPVSVRGGVPGVEVEQPPPDFNPGPRSDQKKFQRSTRVFRPVRPRQTVTIGKFHSAGYACVDVDDFTKHALITGFTGSGKTQTVMNILHQLWADHKKPFLVIESAKTEYRGLLTIPEFRSASASQLLRIYTLGNENVAPLRLNPFELLEGVRVESHVNLLQTCFEAAMPPIGPLSSILEESLVGVYRDMGWMMTDKGVPRAKLAERRFPEMKDFAAKLEQVAETRGYRGDNRATVLASIRGRIMPLTRAMNGSKGKMLDAPFTNPLLEDLFAKPVILELNDLNVADKALVSMFLLTLLREFREQRHKEEKGSELKHITVLEEAHNVLENVSSTGSEEGTGSDVRYRAVQAFCSMLAEVRALGEGLIIADQSPEKLAPDALRNTNIQIAHQLRDARDRGSIGNTMIMSDEQQEYLGKLKPGYAAVFYTGLQRASFVKVPRFDKCDEDQGGRGVKYSAVLSDDTVRAHMYAMTQTVLRPDRPFAGCESCMHFRNCDFRWPSRVLVSEDGGRRERFAGALKVNLSPEERARQVAALLKEALATTEGDEANDASWCYLLHLRHDALKRDGDNPRTFTDGELRSFFITKVVPLLQQRRTIAVGSLGQD
jgi:hypothetical protein